MGGLVDLLGFCVCVCADDESGNIAQDLLTVAVVEETVFMMDVVSRYRLFD